jgi:uncharacterized linocin/CFP29 family protein
MESARLCVAQQELIQSNSTCRTRRRHVELYMQETLTFLVYTAEASVALTS